MIFQQKESDLLNNAINNKKNNITNLNKQILTEKSEYNFLINQVLKNYQKKT